MTRAAAGTDPYAVLGLDRGATPGEAAAAYRRLAKRLHPDVAAGVGAQRQMAEVNSAYALVRDQALRGRAGGSRARSGGGPGGAAAARGRVAGSWLPNEIRGALPLELLVELDPGEQVHIVVGPEPWIGPELVLALTDRRLLWLVDERVLGRVSSLPYTQVRAVETRPSRWRARGASVRLLTLADARHTFRGLSPAVAADVAARVRGRVRPRPPW